MARRPFPYPVEYELGPFLGVRDQVDAKPGPRDQLAGASNVYRDSDAEGVWRTRPGLNKLAALQLGTATSRVGQAVFQATRLDGSEYSYLFVGGRLYEYLWPTVEYADRTPSPGTTAPTGFTIHPTNRIYCVMFADYMIVSDGANRPWKWNPSTRTATYLTDLAVQLFGPIWVYYSKLFGIKATERNVLVWSEELNPDVGYENALYNNRWVLGQTSQDPLEGGYGTNTQIYLFRNVSALGISGAVTSEFQTQGTADDYPTGLGKGAGAGVLRFDGQLYFLDTLFRPTRIAPGDQFEPIWQSIWSTVRGFDTAAGHLVSATVVPELSLVLFAIPTVAELLAGTTRPSRLYVFGSDGTFQGTWTGPGAFLAMGLLKSQDRVQRVVFLDDQGYARSLALQASAGTTDDGAAIPWQIDLPQVGEGRGVEVALDLAELYGSAGQVLALLSYADHRGQRLQGLPVELGYRSSAGLDWVGLMLTPRLEGSSTVSRVGFLSARFEGFAMGNDSGVR